MIKEIKIFPKIEEKELVQEIVAEGSGKILKVRVNLNPKMNVKIFTNEDERVLSVDENGTYYPRADITKRKYSESVLIIEGQSSHDYYYFNGLLIVLERDSISISKNKKNVFNWKGFDEEESEDKLSISIMYDDLK